MTNVIQNETPIFFGLLSLEKYSGTTRFHCTDARIQSTTHDTSHPEVEKDQLNRDLVVKSQALSHADLTVSKQ